LLISSREPMHAVFSEVGSFRLEEVILPAHEKQTRAFTLTFFAQA